MTEFSLVPLVNIWLVLGALGGVQLLLQANATGRRLYPEGFIKTLQYLTGIPALGSVALFLLDPDGLSFAFVDLPHDLPVAGLVLFDGAALLIAWSHAALERHWSGDLETVRGHRLVRSGPYAFVRHPLYSSYLLLTVGFFLATADWLVGGMMLAYFVTVAARASKEEEMLLTRLGNPYAAYCRTTPRFVPVPTWPAVLSPGGARGRRASANGRTKPAVR